MIIVEGNYKISKPAHRPSFPAPRVHVPPPLPPRRQRGATNLQQLDDPLILPHRYKSSYISPSCPLPPGSHSVIRSSCLFKLSLPLFFYFYFISFYSLFCLVWWTWNSTTVVFGSFGCYSPVRAVPLSLVSLCGCI